MGLDWFDKLLDKIGFTNVVLLLLILNQIGLLNKFKFWKQKKKQENNLEGGGDDVSAEATPQDFKDAKFEYLRNHYIELKKEVEKMREADAGKEVRVSILENDNGHIKEVIGEMKSDIKGIYGMVGDIKNFIIQNKNQ